jgi:hypothetical protein
VERAKLDGWCDEQTLPVGFKLNVNYPKNEGKPRKEGAVAWRAISVSDFWERFRRRL